LSVRDNLRLVLRSDRGFAQAVERVYEHFPFLTERLSQRAGTLSGGEQKMLILGRALMLRPKLLLIDEISEGLQPSVVER
ncbi:MAG: ATP-binding cassette domain-containing protein, partial [Mesorhizobium sp.]